MSANHCKYRPHDFRQVYLFIATPLACFRIAALVFGFGCFTASDMPFGFVFIKYLFHIVCQFRFYPDQSFGHVLMYGCCIPER